MHQPCASRGWGTESAGFAVMRFEDENAHLSLLAVHPFYRRRRIARDPLKRLETAARTAGVGEIRLEVCTGDEAALEFCRRLGYREVLRLPGYCDGYESAFRMARARTVGAE